MPSPIIARANALMHRRRQSAGESEEIPVLTDALDEDDIPILLETAVDTPPAASAPAAPAAPDAGAAIAPMAHQDESLPVTTAAPAAALPPEQLERISREVARRIEQRLAAELPAIVAATLRELLDEQRTEHPSTDA